MAAAVGTAANTAQNNRHNCRHGRLIIAAVDRDDDRLVGIGAKLVGDTGGIDLGDALTFCQRLCCSGVVVEGVGPDACVCINREGAVGGGLRAGETPGAGGAGV